MNTGRCQDNRQGHPSQIGVCYLEKTSNVGMSCQRAALSDSDSCRLCHHHSTVTTTRNVSRKCCTRGISVHSPLRQPTSACAFQAESRNPDSVQRSTAQPVPCAR